MANKTHSVEVIQQKEVFVKSNEVLKEMERAGLLEPYTKYYTPDEDENFSCLRTELLWTNPNPTATFNEQTINVTLSKYDGYRVIFGFHTTTTNTFVQEFVKTDGVLTALSYNSIFRRNITYSDNGLIFSSMDGYKVSDATRIQNDDYLIPYKIEGVLKSPAMIYTGDELREGENVSIKDGVISATTTTTAKQLVCEHTFGAGSSFQCADLDLEADGGVYDIIIGYPQATTLGNTYFRFNNVSGGAAYVYGQFSATTSLSSSINGVADKGLLGMYSSENQATTIMTVYMVEGIPFWHLTYFGYNKGVVMSESYGYTVSGNVKSMQILPYNSLPAGTNIKIYRRIK